MVRMKASCIRGSEGTAGNDAEDDDNDDGDDDTDDDGGATPPLWLPATPDPDDPEPDPDPVCAHGGGGGERPSARACFASAITFSKFLLAAAAASAARSAGVSGEVITCTSAR